MKLKSVGIITVFILVAVVALGIYTVMRDSQAKKRQEKEEKIDLSDVGEIIEENLNK